MECKINHSSKVINCIMKGLCIKTLIHSNLILLVHSDYSQMHIQCNTVDSVELLSGSINTEKLNFQVEIIQNLDQFIKYFLNLNDLDFLPGPI